MRHGCLFILLALAPAALVLAEQPARVRSRSFDIEYTVNDDALPLGSVQLWYTQDHGQSWFEFGLDEDRQSPMPFDAPGEGPFGFFFVLTNSTGASSAPPRPGDTPHQQVLVDFSPPVVQLHPLRQTISLGQTVVQIRWTAIDSQLTARPIEMVYRRPPDDSWLPVVSDPVANTGRYDWRVPEGVSGAIAVRVTVTDQGGHRTESDPQTIELNAASVTKGEIASKPASSAAGSAGLSGEPPALAGSRRAQDRAATLFAEALAHRDRGEVPQALVRLREVIKLDSQKTEAFAEMAGLLYRLGDYDKALGAYDIALRQRPNDRQVLQGSALVYRQKKDYAAAAERLRTILRFNPNDAEVWMNLGDVSVYQGDEVTARECFTRAASIKPASAQVLTDAKERLALLTQTSKGLKAERR